jgi:hypothetical protein
MQKVRVPQPDGELVFTVFEGSAEGERIVHQVTDHLVTPRNAADRDRLLQRIDGARLATPKESGESPPNSDGGNPAGEKG